MQNMDELGFPRGGPKATIRVAGFHTGDIVRAVVPAGLKTAGTHVGRVLVRASKRFDIRTGSQRIEGVGAAYCTALHQRDGYAYTFATETALPPQA
jgi:hypothetical protein